MPFGAHKFYFIDKPPVVYSVLVVLLFANTFLLFGVGLLGRYIFPRASANLPPCPELTASTVALHVPPIICFHAKWGLAIQFILLGLVALTMLIFKKRMHYVNRGRRLS
jgi:hypothetical protein